MGPGTHFSLFAVFRWTTTALHTLIHGLERSEVRGLFKTSAGLVVANAGR